MVRPVVGHRHGEQRGDRPALDDGEVVVDQAPLDVLRTAEMRFDPPAQPHEPQDLRVRQHRLPPPLRRDRRSSGAALGQGLDGVLLGADRLRDDLVVAHGVDVPAHHAGDQRLAEAPGGVHGGDPTVGGHGIGGEEDPGRLREHHRLHDDGHVDPAVVEAVAPAVGDRPLGEQRRPAPPDVLEDRRHAHDVEVRVLLARERRGRQVLRGRAGAHRVGGVLAEPGERGADRRHEVVGQRDLLDHPAGLGADRADRLPVVRSQTSQAFEHTVQRRRRGHDLPERVRRHAEARRHPYAVDPRQLPQVGPLPPDLGDLRLFDLVEPHHVVHGGDYGGEITTS